MLAAAVLLVSVVCGVCDVTLVSCWRISEVDDAVVEITSVNETSFHARIVFTLKSSRVLNLTGLGIKSLAGLTNVSWASVEIFNASYNQISRVSASDFYWCPQIQGVDLTNNRIKNVDEWTFANLLHLRMLNLSNNNLHLFDAAINLPPSLTELDLSNNQLDFVPEFLQGNNLRSLFLCGNHYEQWPANLSIHLEQLEELCLGDLMNQGAEDPGDLTNLRQLKRLHLTSKSRLSSTIINNIDSIEYLSLHLTKITNIDFLSKFPNLISLKMDTVQLESIHCPLKMSSKIRDLRVTQSPNVIKAFWECDISFDDVLSLWLPTNELTTVPVHRFPHLKWVYVMGNALNCDDEWVSQLTQRNVSVLQAEHTWCASPTNRSMAEVMRLGGEVVKPERSGLEEFFDEMSVSREQLFYACVALFVLSVLSLGFLLICLASKYRCGGRCRGRRQCSQRKLMCTEDFYFPRADNEYIFDNFSLSDTLARADMQQHRSTAEEISQ